jgi:hypothetical protein
MDYFYVGDLATDPINTREKHDLAEKIISGGNREGEKGNRESKYTSVKTGNQIRAEILYRCNNKSMNLV